MKLRYLMLAFFLIAPLLGFVPLVPQGVSAESPLVTISANRFVRPDRAGFFLLGANYVGSPDRSWTMWEDGKFDAKVIDADFLKAKLSGVNTLRIFVRSPLQQEIVAGRPDKLDAVVSLAEKHGLYLIVTLYDYREDDLAKAVVPSEAIARRYAGRSAILAYDLKNEPHYQDLAIAKYPGAIPPLQTDVLIRRYGERVKLLEAAAWRQEGDGKNLIPPSFSAQQAYIYANSYRIYREFLVDAGEWVKDHRYQVTTLDYMNSPDSAKWKPFLDVLDQTLAAWLAPQIQAIRSNDRDRLITTGYSDAILAKLPANNALGFVSFHRFPTSGVKALQSVFGLLDEMRLSFPDKPVVFEEFGYSNDVTDSTATSIYETATFLHLMSSGEAGGAKWSLYDVFQGWDARESNFGIYRIDGGGKPISLAMRALGEYASGKTSYKGKLDLQTDPTTSDPRYVFSAPDALFVAATNYADPDGRLSFEAPGVAQVFLSWPGGKAITIATTTAVKLRLDPRALLGSSTVGNLTLRTAGGVAAPFQRQATTVVFEAQAGQSYRLEVTPN
jgi:hypothetical protein